MMQLQRLLRPQNHGRIISNIPVAPGRLNDATIARLGKQPATSWRPRSVER